MDSWTAAPSGHGRPRLRVMDVNAKNIIFLHSERWGERYWPRTSARTSAEHSVEKLSLWAAFPFLTNQGRLAWKT